jgi:hypothetical protein
MLLRSGGAGRDPWRMHRTHLPVLLLSKSVDLGVQGYHGAVRLALAVCAQTLELSEMPFSEHISV